jgi:hypothetical protein
LSAADATGASANEAHKRIAVPNAARRISKAARIAVLE